MILFRDYEALMMVVGGLIKEGVNFAISFQPDYTNPEDEYWTLNIDTLG